jgi:hypothetical protein
MATHDQSTNRPQSDFLAHVVLFEGGKGTILIEYDYQNEEGVRPAPGPDFVTGP